MSSNNQLIIKKINESFKVFINLCVDNNFIATDENLIKEFQKLEDAIKFANDYCKREMIEYGVFIDTKSFGK